MIILCILIWKFVFVSFIVFTDKRNLTFNRMMFSSDHNNSSVSLFKYHKNIEDECSTKIQRLVIDKGCDKQLALLYNNRGHAKYMQVEFYSAVDDYNKALQYDQSLAVVYYNRATVHYRMGNFEDAVADMEKALSLDSTNKEFIEGYKECRIMFNTKKMMFDK